MGQVWTGVFPGRDSLDPDRYPEYFEGQTKISCVRVQIARRCLSRQVLMAFGRYHFEAVLRSTWAIYSQDYFFLDGESISDAANCSIL